MGWVYTHLEYHRGSIVRGRYTAMDKIPSPCKPSIDGTTGQSGSEDRHAVFDIGELVQVGR